MLSIGLPHRTLSQDQRGSVAPLFAIALAGLVGIGALTFDVSRAMSLRAEMASAADAAALAGASQLTATSGSIARATSAAQSALAQNSQSSANVAGDITIPNSNLVFLSALSPRTVTTSDTAARFVEVTLSPLAMTKSFGRVVGSSGAINVNARAVAGYTSAICKVPPLMICNPGEAGGNLTFDGDNFIGRGVVLKSAPGNAVGAGNFGYLAVSSGGSAGALLTAMGKINPPVECFGTLVETKTGQAQSILRGFNTRFDLYHNSMNAEQNSADWQPALNTLTGMITPNNGNACNASVPPPASAYQGCSSASVPTAMGLPNDCCAYGASPTCEGGVGPGTSAFGNGSWDRAKYFQVNHAGFSWSTQSASYWDAWGPAPATGISRPTRYQVYRWETAILSGALAKPAGAFSANQDVTAANRDAARPACYTGPAATQQTPDRRAISVVVTNCADADIRGRTNVPVIAYADIFLTQPVTGNATDSIIFGEVIGATTNVSAVGVETRNYWVRLNE
jgi:Flp pilus assembly protein TadG